MVRFTKVTSAAVLAACVVLGACNKSDNTATTDSAAALGRVGPDSASAMAAVNPAEEAKTNAEILATMHAVNQGEIAEGKLVASKTKRADIKEFANQLVADHTQLDADGTALAAKLGITPMMKDSGMVKDAMKEQKELQDKKAGKDFDNEYLEKQVSGHQKVLDFLSKSISDTHNADIKAALQTAQTKVQAHLDAAKALKDKPKA